MNGSNSNSSRKSVLIPDVRGQEIHDFVQREYGQEEAKKLKNIEKGGANNEKGSKYERYCAVSKIVEEAAVGRLNSLVANQATAFVDDLTVIILDELNENTTGEVSIAKKTNYQIKNSSTTGQWSDEHMLRFIQQEGIDRNYFKAKESKQIMLVSDIDSFKYGKEKQVRNNPNAKSRFGYEYLSYNGKTSEFIALNSLFRGHLEKICDRTELDWIDGAFSMLLGSWESFSYSGYVSISEIIDHAKEFGKPDLLGGIGNEVYTIPLFLIDKCSTLNIEKPVIKSGRISLMCNGLEIAISIEQAKLITEPSVQACETALDLVKLLMEKAAYEFS